MSGRHDAAMSACDRDVLILFPKKQLYDWVKYIYPDEQMECPEPMTHDEADIFLIPEFDHHSDAIEYLKENYLEFFQQELFDWTTDENLWPERLTWELFEKWIDFSIQSVVMDTLDKRIIKENYL